MADAPLSLQTGLQISNDEVDAARISVLAGSAGSVQDDWLDQQLPFLWNNRLSVALETAGTLYAPDDDTEFALQETEEKVILHFWRLLIKAAPHMPELPEARYRVVVQTIQRILNIVRQTPTDENAEEFLAVALRPIRRLALGALTDDVCAALIDYRRGRWTPYLTRPQLHLIETALARTVAALPPDDMESFWENMHSPDPLARSAMLLGLRFISTAHAVPHLLHGLERSRDHALRAAIVDHLEEIAEPSAIPTLMRLLRETATTDWTLSRQIARTIRVIEKQNAGGNHRTLLRPAMMPPARTSDLLRPVRGATPSDAADLLRPAPSAASSAHGEPEQPSKLEPPSDRG